MKKVLLYSGGMDSWLISKLWKPDTLLYIDINSSYSEQEIARLPINVQINKMLDLSSVERDDKIIPLRNLYFVMIASYYGDEICVGATAGDRVLDKSSEFVQKATDMLSFLYSKQHWTEGEEKRVVTPYKNYTKTMLLAEYLKNGGDISEAFYQSFSCYHPDELNNVCWECKPCFRKYVAFKNNGFDFSDETELKVTKYAEKEILPLIFSKQYGRAEEEAEILKAFGVEDGFVL